MLNVHSVIDHTWSIAAATAWKAAAAGSGCCCWGRPSCWGRSCQATSWRGRRCRWEIETGRRGKGQTKATNGIGAAKEAWARETTEGPAAGEGDIVSHFICGELSLLWEAHRPKQVTFRDDKIQIRNGSKFDFVKLLSWKIIFFDKLLVSLSLLYLNCKVWFVLKINKGKNTIEICYRQQIDSFACNQYHRCRFRWWLEKAGS